MSIRPRVMFAAPSSGTGKTTVVCAFLQALLERELAVRAFKCGPDYIDPMFHSEVMGIPSRNLDLFFTEPKVIRSLFCEHSEGADISVIEGVMGYFDGIGGSERASSYQLAAETGTPVILVLDPKGAALSLAALVRGFREFRCPDMLAGVLLNNCTPSLYGMFKPIIEREAGIPVVGALPPLPDCSLKSRHLGLIAAEEVEGLREKLRLLGSAFESSADIGKIIDIAKSAPPIERLPMHFERAVKNNPVIGVAKDAAFCFYYADNLELLEKLGARIKYFSPMSDEKLPEGLSALYLGGGYPELHAGVLAKNGEMRRQIAEAVGGGMPTIAECGGFMYLLESIRDSSETTFPFCGVLDGEAFSTGCLRRFGYINITAKKDNLLCGAGESIAAHEFHYWDSSANGMDFRAEKASGSGGWDCITATDTIVAGFPHMYFYSSPHFAANFVAAAGAYKEKREGGGPA